MQEAETQGARLHIQPDRKSSGRAAPPQDARLAGWSNLLYALVILIMLTTIGLTAHFLLYDGKVVLSHQQQMYIFFMQDLPWFEFCVSAASICIIETTWICGLWQLLRLAGSFRRGGVFDEDNARRLVRLSGVLAIISVLDMLRRPIIAAVFYWRDVTPWMSELPLIHFINPSYVLAAIFFLILGKVMGRATELEKESRLYI